MSVLEIEEKVLELSNDDKLGLIQRMWHSIELVDDSVPAWHEDVLSERAKRIDSGDANFRPWSEVRKTLGLQ